MAQVLEPVSYDPGDCIIAEGDTAGHAMYILAAGRAEARLAAVCACQGTSSIAATGFAAAAAAAGTTAAGATGDCGSHQL